MGILIPVVVAILVAAVAIAGTLFVLERRANTRIKVAEHRAEEILAEAEQTRRDAAIAAKDESIRLRNDLDREISSRRKDMERIERRIEQKKRASTASSRRWSSARWPSVGRESALGPA
jgi:ribonuclease Y